MTKTLIIKLFYQTVTIKIQNFKIPSHPQIKLSKIHFILLIPKKENILINLTSSEVSDYIIISFVSCNISSTYEVIIPIIYFKLIKFYERFNFDNLSIQLIICKI